MYFTPALEEYGHGGQLRRRNMDEYGSMTSQALPMCFQSCDQTPISSWLHPLGCLKRKWIENDFDPSL